MNEIMYALFFTLSALQVGDVVTTNRILANGGREANPLVDKVMQVTGPWWPIVKLPALLLFGYLTWFHPGYYLMVLLGISSAVYVVVVWHNARQV